LLGKFGLSSLLLYLNHSFFYIFAFSVYNFAKGKTMLETYLYKQKEEMGSPYFTEVERL
jgi:hypothetical protein